MISSGKLINRGANAVSHDTSSSSSEHSTVPWRTLGIPSDVTSVVATPTALRAFLQCLSGPPLAMLSRLRSLFGRESGRHPETRERQKEALLQGQRKTRTKKWLWRRQSESWPGDKERVVAQGWIWVFQ